MNKLSNEFKAINCGTNIIDVTHHKNIEQYRPTELHLKINGGLNDEASIAIVMEHFERSPVIGQLTIEMLTNTLKELGYTLIKSKLYYELYR